MASARLGLRLIPSGGGVIELSNRACPEVGGAYISGVLAPVRWSPRGGPLTWVAITHPD